MSGDAKTYTRTVIVRDGADMGIHTVACVNDHYYVCDRCGIAGSERWAILHQYPFPGAVGVGDQ